MYEGSDVITLAVSRGGFTGVAAQQKDERCDGQKERRVKKDESE